MLAKWNAAKASLSTRARRAGLTESHFQFLRFGVVGAAGFTTDACTLYLLIRAGVDPYLARVASFPVAVTVTWFLNRIWTFAAHGKGGSAHRQYLGYFIVQIAGALVNYMFYAATLSLMEPTAANAIKALAVGAIFGLIVNFTGAKMLVFRNKNAPAKKP